MVNDMTNAEKRELHDRYLKALTRANAKEYAATSEKFIYCLNLLDLSLVDDGDTFCDYWVNQLENRFDQLNGERHESH